MSPAASAKLFALVRQEEVMGGMIGKTGILHLSPWFQIQENTVFKEMVL